MRVYIAGPMSNIPDQNRTAFIVAADQIRAVGHDPVNPIEQADPDLVAMADRLGPDFVHTPEYEVIINKCKRTIDKCDALLMLPGWGASKGARQEHKYAKQTQKLIFHSVDELGGAMLKWTGPEEYGPTRSYVGDAGFDLYVSAPTKICVNEFVDVPLGINVELPVGMWAMLTGRSSTLRRRRLLVAQGVIDSGYRGPLYAGVQNMGESVVRLEAGERIAQLIPFQQVSAAVTPYRVAELGESDRGVSGFGSTGP